MAISCRNHQMRTNSFVCTVCRLRGRHAEVVVPYDRRTHPSVGRGHVPAACRNYQMRANLQPEIATTSVRTGLAMTNKGCLSVSLRGAQRRGNLGEELPSAYR